MNDLTITVKHLQRGQPRSYADHQYRSEIIIEADRTWNLPSRDQITKLVSLVVHPFSVEVYTGSMDSYFKPRLRILECTYAEEIENTTHRQSFPYKGRKEIWIAEVVEPYCD